MLINASPQNWTPEIDRKVSQPVRIQEPRPKSPIFARQPALKSYFISTDTTPQLLLGLLDSVANKDVNADDLAKLIPGTPSFPFPSSPSFPISQISNTVHTGATPAAIKQHIGLLRKEAQEISSLAATIGVPVAAPQKRNRDYAVKPGRTVTPKAKDGVAKGKGKGKAKGKVAVNSGNITIDDWNAAFAGIATGAGVVGANDVGPAADDTDEGVVEMEHGATQLAIAAAEARGRKRKRAATKTADGADGVAADGKVDAGGDGDGTADEDGAEGKAAGKKKKKGGKGKGVVVKKGVAVKKELVKKEMGEEVGEDIGGGAGMEEGEVVVDEAVS